MASRTRRRPIAPATLDHPYPNGPELELEVALDAAHALLEHGSPADRVAATRYDPLLFGVLYLSHHLLAQDETEPDAADIETEGPTAGRIVTLADWHLDLAAYALTAWTDPRPAVRRYRDIFAAPRDSGKSTWLYLILPLWAGAHQWSTFAATFAAVAAQAETHLGTMRLELEGNDLLRTDHPTLCEPMHRRGARRTVSDRIDQLHQANGFRIVARGIDRSTLGLKIGADRPDLILLDDLEPDEASYSELLARKRRRTLLEAVLPMNLRARVVYTGTVVMFGSIVHQALRHSRGELTDDELVDAAWVDEEHFTVHHVLPITEHPAGRRSYWPARYPLADLEAMEGTRSYRKNYLNLPLPGEGDYWTEDLYRYGELPDYGATILYVDPAVTTRATSDYTGVAIVSRGDDTSGNRALWIRYTTRFKAVGARRRSRLEAILANFPDVRRVVVETNQGGDDILESLDELGPPVVGYHETLSKEARAERVLDYYERRPSRIVHVGAQPLLEAEQTGFPEAATRDVLDAANGAVIYLTRRPRRSRGASSSSYL